MKRGDIVVVDIPPPNPAQPSHVQAGRRPAVIVQVDSAITALRTVTVVPLTSRLRARRFPRSLEVQPTVLNGLAQPSVLLVHQITTVDQQLIAATTGELDSADMARLEEKLREFLSL